MALVATINGVQVHSDKQVRSVSGTRIEFGDGSWCDVTTGQVVNRGRGEISIGSAMNSSSEKTTTKGPTLYQASSLYLRRLTADVSVELYRGSGLEVTTTGPASEVETISADVRDGKLVIEGGPESSSHGTVFGSSSVVFGSSVSITQVVRGRSVTSVYTGGSGDINRTKVTVKVPHGTPITVAGGIGNTRIGDIEGPLSAQVSASGSVEAGRMSDVDLQVQGSGDIRIAEVNGVAHARIQGSGDVNIDGGNMNTLTASVMGSGDVTVDGLVQEASLSVMGSGDIRVAHVVRQPIKSVMGSGDIRVRRVG